MSVPITAIFGLHPCCCQILERGCNGRHRFWYGDDPTGRSTRCRDRFAGREAKQGQGGREESLGSGHVKLIPLYNVVSEGCTRLVAPQACAQSSPSGHGMDAATRCGVTSPQSPLVERDNYLTTGHCSSGPAMCRWAQSDQPMCRLHFSVIGGPVGHTRNPYGTGFCSHVVFGLHLCADHRGRRAAIDGIGPALCHFRGAGGSDCTFHGAKLAPNTEPVEGDDRLRHLPERALSRSQLCRHAED